MTQGARSKTINSVYWLALLAAMLLSLPPARALIEQSMVWHMIVQMPLLVIAGYGLASLSTSRMPYFARSNQFGLTSFMMMLLILTYWMLPVTIDRAVTRYAIDATKVVSMLACGYCLKRSLQVAPQGVSLFFIGYSLAMLVMLGVYFVTTDLRLCNAYSLESQVRAGYGLFALSFILLACCFAYRKGMN
jgi:hypothetical protein